MAVRVILIKLPITLEITNSGRSSRRNDLGLRFLAAIAILGRVRLHGNLTLSDDFPFGLIPIMRTLSHPCSTKCLSLVVNQTLPRGDGIAAVADCSRCRVSEDRRSWLAQPLPSSCIDKACDDDESAWKSY
jgi:hypothetical protein